MRHRPHSPRSAFSLLEVVIAIGIFAVGMVGVIGLFASTTKSVSNLTDAEAAANVADVLRDELTHRVRRDQSFTAVAALLKKKTASNSHELTDADRNPNAASSDPRRDPQLLFASRDGTKIGAYKDTATWGVSDVDKFFEIALIRNETLSPAADATATPPTDPDATAPMLAYTARIRWPAFVPDGTPTNPQRALPFGFNATGAIQFDHGQQQVMHIAGSVTR